MTVPAIAKQDDLPATYRAARSALAECDRLDECKDWDDKAAALAVYARQSQDVELEAMAARIRARARIRCGELLAEIEPAHGANQNIKAGRDPIVSRKQAAADAGLSERQAKQAVRLSKLDRSEQDAMIERESPATLTELDEAAKRKAVVDVVKGGLAGATKSRKNPLHTPDPMRERMLRLASNLEAITMETAEDIAAWDGPEKTKDRLFNNIRLAHAALSDWMQKLWIEHH